MNQAPRYDFLDWLRVIAIFVLIFFHTGMLFVGWGWHITNDEVIEGLRGGPPRGEAEGGAQPACVDHAAEVE